jgi:DnaJ-class molecular chaperone
VAVTSDRDPDPDPKACPWCKGSRHCATCQGTGTRLVRTRILRRTQTADCLACDGSGVCQLCKPRHAVSA